MGMLLKIHTVHWVIFDGEVETVELPTKVGFLAILPHHNPLTAMIVPGIVKFIPVFELCALDIQVVNFWLIQISFLKMKKLQ